MAEIIDFPQKKCEQEELRAVCETPISYKMAVFEGKKRTGTLYGTEDLQVFVPIEDTIEDYTDYMTGEGWYE